MAKTGDTGQIQVNISGGTTKTVSTGGANVKQALAEQFRWALGDGNGALQYNRVVVKSGSATTTPATVIDCSGTTTDDFGDATDMTEILAILVYNTSTSGNFLLGSEANNVAQILTDGLNVPPGDGTNHGFAMMLSPTSGGIGITAATGDLLTGQASTGTVNYKVVVIGRA